MNPFLERNSIMKVMRNLARSSEPIEELVKSSEEIECKNCGNESLRSSWKENRYVCPHCGFHAKISAMSRIKMVVDSGSFRQIGRGLKVENPIGFPDYEKKLAEMREKTGLADAVVIGTAKINGRKIVIAAMDNRFMMASMGMVVGEKITRAFEYATKRKLPIVVFSTSGGARMQEGIMSLIQMAKTASAAKRHSEAGLLYVSVMSNPTTGGVFASFASLGDIHIAEKDALIGFAGPRVIEQTIGEKLPKGFQYADFQYEHGMVDMVVERKDMRGVLEKIIGLHTN